MSCESFLTICLTNLHIQGKGIHTYMMIHRIFINYMNIISLNIYNNTTDMYEHISMFIYLSLYILKYRESKGEREMERYVEALLFPS